MTDLDQSTDPVEVMADLIRDHTRHHAISNAPYGHICSPDCLARTLSVFYVAVAERKRQDEALATARSEAMDWLRGVDRPAGLDGRFAGPLGLVRAIITEADRRISTITTTAVDTVSAIRSAAETAINSVYGTDDRHAYMALKIAETAVNGAPFPWSYDGKPTAASDDALSARLRELVNDPEVVQKAQWRLDHYGPLDAEPFQYSRYASPAHAALSALIDTNDEADRG